MLSILPKRAGKKGPGRKKMPAPERRQDHHSTPGAIPREIEARVLARWSSLIHAASISRFTWMVTEHRTEKRVPATGIIGVLLMLDPDRSPMILECKEDVLRKLVNVTKSGATNLAGDDLEWLYLKDEGPVRPDTWLTDNEVRQAATMAIALACDARRFVAALFNAAGRRTGVGAYDHAATKDSAPVDVFHCTPDDMCEAVLRMQKIYSGLANSRARNGRPVGRPREGRWLTPKGLRNWTDELLASGAMNVEHTIITRSLFYEDPYAGGSPEVQAAVTLLKARCEPSNRQMTNFRQVFTAVEGAPSEQRLLSLERHCRFKLGIPGEAITFRTVTEEFARTFLPSYGNAPFPDDELTADEERIVIISFDPTPSMPEYYRPADSSDGNTSHRVDTAFVFEHAQPMWSDQESRMVRRLPTRHAQAIVRLLAATAASATPSMTLAADDRTFELPITLVDERADKADRLPRTDLQRKASPPEIEQSEMERNNNRMSSNDGGSFTPPNP